MIMTDMDIANIMAQGNYFTFNKIFARQLGLEEALVLGALINRYKYYYDKGLLDEDCMFYCTVNTLQEDTTLSDYQQRKCFNNLENAGVITTERKGLPAKRYIKLNADKIIDILRK